MKQASKFSIIFLATASTVAFGQAPSSQAIFPKASGAPAAYVYVTSSPSSGVTQIDAYSAAASGKLTAVAGSPSEVGSEGLGQMAVNGKYLFAAGNYTNIYSFSIAANGALQQLSQIDASTYNPYGSGGPGSLFLDHTGATLYDGDIYAYGTGSNAYQAFGVDGSTGQLNFLQLTPDGGEVQGEPLSFIGNNLYAYSAGKYQASGFIFGYQRSGDGTLIALNIAPALPVAPNGGYAPFLAAADPGSNLAITLAPFNGFAATGPSQIAVYTADAAGNLTTTSTAQNMPKVKGSTNSYVTDLKMAPSGQLLAVAGAFGLQVFHFNGARPATTYTTLLTNITVDQMFWDKSNHLYAISGTAGKLYVFTVTPTTHGQATGSPYSITGPQGVQVLPE